uniref:non-specific serine/threonine protein kinase n=1 Tax=Pelusios castaneus TaxID=367368 RepID=A0A8C8S439_9SAUR
MYRSREPLASPTTCSSPMQIRPGTSPPPPRVPLLHTLLPLPLPPICAAQMGLWLEGDRPGYVHQGHLDPIGCLSPPTGSCAPSPLCLLLSADVWSLGVILYMLVCGQPPFQEANDSETLTMIMDCRYNVPPHVSSQCSDLITMMLRRDPQQRASLEQIEMHPWLQGVDPSPASRSLLPLTSHRRVSEEEHNMIMQAMTCGNIADRDAIQEALEADRYNHITATYFLLAERILREKQSHKLSLVYNLAQQVQNSTKLSDPFGAVGDTRDLSPFSEIPDRLAAFSSPQSSTERAGSVLAEDSGKRDGVPISFSALGEEDTPSSIHGNGQLVRALLSPSLTDAPLAKSAPALQQICEEEEEEEEEEEGKVDAMERKSSSLNQEQMRDFQSSRVSLLFCRGTVTHSKGEKSLGSTKPGPLEQAPRPLSRAPRPKSEQSQLREVMSHDTEWEATDNFSLSFREDAPDPLSVGTPAGEGDGEQEDRGVGLERYEAKDDAGPADTTTLKMEDGGSLGQCPRIVDSVQYPGHCAGPVPGSAGSSGLQDGRNIQITLSGTLAPDDMPKKPDGTLETGASNRPKPLAESTMGSETVVENMIKLDPAKNKSANLKDRILQFPLCEKALAFKIRPSSKENLLSLGQFNCCHVI